MKEYGEIIKLSDLNATPEELFVDGYRKGYAEATGGLTEVDATSMLITLNMLEKFYYNVRGLMDFIDDLNIKQMKAILEPIANGKGGYDTESLLEKISTELATSSYTVEVLPDEEREVVGLDNAINAVFSVVRGI